MDRFPATALLPGNATPFMKAHLQAMIEAWPLEVEEIVRQGDPDRCDPHLLPILFFGRGGTVWSDAWTVDRKRFVVRNQRTLKRLEGTPRGLEAYLNLADSLVFREWLPPSSSFAIPDRGRITADAIRALMPQLRLYHRWPDRSTAGRAFAGARHAGRHFAVRDVIGPRGRYPVLWDRGEETPLGVADAGADGQTATLVYEGGKGSGAYAGRAFAGAARLGRPSGGRSLSFDLLDPDTVTIRVAVPVPRPVAVAGRGGARATFARRDEAGAGDFERLILNDPSRVPAQGAGATVGAFAGAALTGLPAFHILLKASVPGDPAFVPPRWRFAGQAYAIPERGRALRFAMRAAAAAARPGDRVLIELNPTAKGGRINPLPVLAP